VIDLEKTMENKKDYAAQPPKAGPALERQDFHGEQKQNGSVEVLAPAGGPEALRAAVFAGADAVYLGGPAFGARANAKNFTREQLREAAEFCHARGVRVHVTVNTLLKDSELPAALDLVSYLCSLPVDAVLVQDMGLFALLRERAPKLPLHASTQMSLHTPGGAKLLYELGASRVVLARELSLAEIGEISAGCPVELEAFVHGALCMSVSGQCYFSAMLGGRSGNRGMCAQPCRLPFAGPAGTGHDLSLKDLSFIKEIERLREAGVCSAKIEGRMKRPEYVAAAVSACRKAADGEPVPEELTRNLEAVFSRSGFTDGYLTGRRGAKMFGIRTREDVTGATEKVFSSLRGLYRGENQRVPVRLALERRDGGYRLTAWDEKGAAASPETIPVGDPPPALTAERCEAQLKKTGGTPFLAEKVSVPEEGAAIPVSALNALRRDVLEQLLEQRAHRPSIPFAEKPYKAAPRLRQDRKPGERLPVRACFRSAEQVPKEARECRELVLPLGTNPAALERLREEGFPPILLELPRAMFGAEKRTEEMMQERMARGFREFICGNLGHLSLGRKLGAGMHGSFSLNIFNTAALDSFQALGLSSAEVSFELTGRELSALGGALPRGVMVYGRQALMLTRNCPLANSPKGCLRCKTTGCLTDRMRKKFPVICTGAGSARYSEVLNSVPLWLGDKELSGMDFGVFRFTVENSVECGGVLSAFFRQETLGLDYTRGLFSRGVE